MEHALTMVLTALVLYLFTRDLSKPALRTSEGSIALSYGSAIRMTGWFVGLLPPMALVLGMIFSNGLFDDPAFLFTLLFTSLLAFRMVTAIFGQRILATPIGLHSSVWGREKCRFSWAEVVQVTHNTLAGTLVFHSINGQKLRISHYRRGINELDNLLRRNLLQATWEPAFHKMLQEQSRLI